MMHLLQDVLHGESTQVRSSTSYQLSSNDPHLTRSHYETTGHFRVDLLSVTKPVINTHYKSKNITILKDDEICVDNGLQYRLYDTASHVYGGAFTYKNQVAKECTYILPFTALQRFIHRPASAPDGLAPNAVIASQDSCPDAMTLDEYRELACIPLGRHIQWANILLQLAMPGVDFKKSVTTLVFLQCIYQAGPTGTHILRDNHSFFSSERQALTLLQHLSQALTRMKENWESSQALCIFIAIVSRALTLSPFTPVHNRCRAILATARHVAIDWVVALRDKAFTAREHEHRNAFVSKSVEVALICTSTYDVDDDHLAEILAQGDGTSILVQSSIVIQEGEQVHSSVAEQYLTLLRWRFKRLLRRSYRVLAQQTDGLNDAISKSWSACAPGDRGWLPASELADHWLTTNTAVTYGASMVVHYNTLDGELLVNGLPLAQPPKEYRNCSLYSVFFGTTAVEVMPSSTPGFQFSVKRSFDEHAVQMGLDASSEYPGKELVLRATKGGMTYDLIPRRLFRGVFPVHFVDDYVHRLDIASSTVEFRPAAQPWNSSSPNKWILSKQCDRGAWQLAKDGSSVIGLRSATSSLLSHVLTALAHQDGIHNILEPAKNMLQTTIPTLRLGFSLAESSAQLVSQEYRSMIVDVDQTVGALIGLRSKLMLRPLKYGRRMVLIPDSPSVHYSKQDGHTTVNIPHNSATKIYSMYLDPLLHRLIDNGDLGRKLYVAYLHALTSYCLVDPLTLQTGTEQALAIMESAAVRSFDQLSSENIVALTKLADLSPSRTYYPVQKRVMQTVRWNEEVSFLSQHGHSISIVKKLFRQAEDGMIFFPESQLQLPRLEHVDDYLSARDDIRSATFRTSGSGAEDHTTRHDEHYSARDCSKSSQRMIRAASMSGLLNRHGIDLTEPACDEGSLWLASCGFDTIYGPQEPIEVSRVGYDASVIHHGHDSIIRHLPAFHEWLADPAASSPYKFSVLMWMSTVALTEDVNTAILQTIAMIFKSPALAEVRPPRRSSFSPKEGIACSEKTLRAIVTNHRRNLQSCPEFDLERETNEKRKHYEQRRQRTWQQASDRAVNIFINDLVAQWPCRSPITPSRDTFSTYIDVNKAFQAAQRKFVAWHENGLLSDYLESIEPTISVSAVQPVQIIAIPSTVPSRKSSLPDHVSEGQLFLVPAPHLPTDRPKVEFAIASPKRLELESTLLGPLLDVLETMSYQSKYERWYVAELRHSLDALLEMSHSQPSISDVTTLSLTAHLSTCSDYVKTIYEALVFAVAQSTRTANTEHSWQLRRTSPMVFLQQLKNASHLTETWKACIVHYAVALTALQQAERLVMLADQSAQEDLIAEMRNSGHQNWDPMEYPECLLMEVESGILIREVQEQIASKMRDPPSGENAVMQLNMGEGKSSVIVPMVAIHLTNRQQLVRVVVAKPQSKQMAQMLISKLGGILNRRIFYMPVSRSLKLSKAAAMTISRMLHECMTQGGVLLVQPEHILSLQLMSPECYISDKDDIGRELTSIQDFFDCQSRDLIDESDENFSVRFELIYTMGTQRLIELSPDRWLLAQQIFELIRLHALEVSKIVPLSIEYRPGVTGSLPRVRILRPDAADLLLNSIATHISSQGIGGLQVGRQPEAIRDAIHRYITQPELSNEDIDRVESSPFWTATTNGPLLLLRGLLAGGVLAFVLGQKRWRVNYGLTHRTKVAVPYRAKDSASPRSEFSHPDVVIALTSLSYYYGGLSDEAMFNAMEHLVEADQSDIEYQACVRDACKLPDSFRQLSGINLKDRRQCIAELFPALRQAKSVIDYYLSHLVFPKEMKEFPYKLSASGWDLGKQKERPVTGFLGINDSRCLLPITVDHLDLPEQKHTSALVLENILQPENCTHLLEPTPPRVSDAEHLLRTVISLKPPVQVILDVGAQILELDNVSVAKTWLDMHDTTKQAAVFVNENDDLCVIDRSGREEMLRISPYSSQLDRCLVFLDEAHTRGIDLRLPDRYRAAVTLGANLTKDRLVQACMRMRKLGKGQTLVFCIPQEIKEKISERTLKTGSDLFVADVLHHSMTETHTEARRSIPLWARQGERFVRHEKIWQDAKISSQTSLSRERAERFQENEAQSLDDRYRPRQSDYQPPYLINSSDPQLSCIAERREQFDDLQFRSSTLQEEQERELSPEIEQERQVQRPPAAQPVAHRLRPDVRAFATSGVLTAKFPAYKPAFEALRDTSAAETFSTAQFTADRRLLVTEDFARTTQALVGASHQRPVQWMLTARGKKSSVIEHILIVSPSEANQLHNIMTASDAATLHIYKSRTNPGYASLSKLDLYNVSARAMPPVIPRSLAIQLDLFAGQLYISSYGDYRAICSFLGLYPDAITEDMTASGWKVSAEGFILSDDQGLVGGDSGFEKSPVKFFTTLMSSIRRNGKGIGKTHMGSLLEGKLFKASDFEVGEDE